MSKKASTKVEPITKITDTIEDEDYIPETVFARIKVFWFFNRPGMRQVPYIQDLEVESLIIYLIPSIILTIGVFFIGLTINSDIELINLLIASFLTFIIEIIGILVFIIVLLIIMRFILPGFPKESHARPKMVIISFSYVYLTKIILNLGFIQVYLFSTTSSLTIGVLSYYIFSVYFVVVTAFSIKSLTGTGLINSLIGGLFLYFPVIIVFALL